MSRHMTDALLAEAETHQGITSLHPFRGVGRPEDIAKVYVFLASDDASWISGVCAARIRNEVDVKLTQTKVNLPVDGAYTAR